MPSKCRIKRWQPCSATWAALLFALVRTTPAADLVWVGATGDWFGASNWSPAQAPTNDGDIVTVTNGCVLLTNSTAGLASFTISNATLMFSNWNTTLSATNIAIANNGVITLSDAFTNGQPSNSICLVCSNMTLDAGGKILADARGYARLTGPGSGVSVSMRYRGSGGGGYGAKGGTGGYPAWGTVLGAGGNPYGSTNAPNEPGSGGGGLYDYAMGGHGGGVVRIAARGTVSVDGGLVTANGGPGGNIYSDTPCGGGAGGSIFISCGAFVGNAGGILRANGGNAANGPEYSGFAGGGSGGRIAIAIGFSEADLAKLVAGEDIPGLLVYSQDPAYTGSLSVTNGADDFHRTITVPPDGAQPGTIRYLRVLVPGECGLTITGDPAQHGTPATNGYCTWILPVATVITNTVTSPVDELNGMNWTCCGWRLDENGGGLITNGVSTQAVFTVNTNATLTWLWTNAFKLAFTAGPNGTVNSNNLNGWYTNGSLVTGILATADPGYYFVTWAGADVPLGQTTNNPLWAIMDRARTNIFAAFASQNGETKVWNGVGNWTSFTNWAPPGIPGSNDSAWIQSGTATLSEAYSVGALAVSNGATVVFSNWTTCITASNVTVLGNGVITLPPAFTTNQMSNRVWVVCSNFTIAAGGMINADERGYFCANGPGRGEGAGGGYGSGGGYGGQGGMGLSKYAVGMPYGSTGAPLDPGSGGGTYPFWVSAHGGGAVRIEAADTATIDGIISANGKNGNVAGQAGGGGGSGGAIYISCRTFGGGTGGVLRANGGNGSYESGYIQYAYGAGGGGRIAVVYQSLEGMPGVRFSAGHGITPYPVDINYPAEKAAPQVGTLFFTDPSLLDSVVSAWGGTGSCLNGYFVFQSTNVWTPANLVALDNSTIGILEGSTLRVTNDLRIATGGLVVATRGTLDCDRNLRLTNSASLVVYGAETNASRTDYGAIVDIGNTLMIASNCWIYPFSHSTNGGSVLFQVGGMEISGGGGINADGRGYARAKGPGRGVDATLRYRGSGGGGFGGKGGAGITTGGGAIYGVTNAPSDAGSGGGGLCDGILAGGHGGGLVRIAAGGNVKIDGVVTANGGVGGSIYGDTACGGGSGGAIFINCASFAGNASGLLCANGGNGGVASGVTNGGGGGGGRIAVWINIPPIRQGDVISNGNLLSITITNAYAKFAGTASVSCGLGFTNSPPDGAVGGSQMFVIYTPPPGMAFTVR